MQFISCAFKLPEDIHRQIKLTAQMNQHTIPETIISMLRDALIANPAPETLITNSEGPAARIRHLIAKHGSLSKSQLYMKTLDIKFEKRDAAIALLVEREYITVQTTGSANRPKTTYTITKAALVAIEHLGPVVSRKRL